MALGKGLNSLIPQNKPAASKSSSSKRSGTPSSGGQIIDIRLEDIVPNPEQPRKNFSHKDLEELVLSIKEHGIMQPINVIELPAGGYELISGERRFRASQIAGKKTIPAIVRTATDQQKLELALIENIQRQNLNPIEEAIAFKRLIDVFGLTQEEASRRVGKSRSAVANTIRLLDLPDVIRKALIDGQVSMGKARALLSLESKKEQLTIFREMMGEGINVRDVEEQVRNKAAKSRKGSVRKDPNLMAQEHLLEERLGTKVTITQKGTKGNITIHYDGLGELKRLIDEVL